MPRPEPSSLSPDRVIAATIARLLMHYWAPMELSEEARQLMARDWVYDLEEFGPSIVEQACNEWRKTEERRPTIAAMRKLCAELRPKLAAAVVDHRAHDEDEATRIADEWAIRRGFMNMAHFQRESSVGAAVQMTGGRWKEFPGLAGAAGPDGREIAKRWAQARGYEDLHAYAKAERISYELACMRVVKSNLAAAPERKAAFQSLGGALGVTARETSE